MILPCRHRTLVFRNELVFLPLFIAFLLSFEYLVLWQLLWTEIQILYSCNSYGDFHTHRFILMLFWVFCLKLPYRLSLSSLRVLLYLMVSVNLKEIKVSFSFAQEMAWVLFPHIASLSFWNKESEKQFFLFLGSFLRSFSVFLFQGFSPFLQLLFKPRLFV